jgi:putative transposase
MTKSLVMQALFRATSKNIRLRDQFFTQIVSQYCAHDYQNLLKQFGIVASMSRKGDCWDNVSMESFWGILKNELAHHRKFKNTTTNYAGNYRIHRDLL